MCQNNGQVRKVHGYLLYINRLAILETKRLQHLACMKQNRDPVFQCLLINGITGLIVGIETGSGMQLNPLHTPFLEESSSQLGSFIPSRVYPGKSNQSLGMFLHRISIDSIYLLNT